MSLDQKLSPERKQELKTICESMQVVSDNFYRQAACLENHAFIEFCGLMNEYIKVCEQSTEKGIDFTEVNIHTGLTMAFKDYNLDYIAEKFNCIYGSSIDVHLKLKEEGNIKTGLIYHE